MKKKTIIKSLIYSSILFQVSTVLPINVSGDEIESSTGVTNVIDKFNNEMDVETGVEATTTESVTLETSEVDLSEEKVEVIITDDINEVVEVQSDIETFDSSSKFGKSITNEPIGEVSTLGEYESYLNGEEIVKEGFIKTVPWKLTESGILIFGGGMMPHSDIPFEFENISDIEGDFHEIILTERIIVKGNGAASLFSNLETVETIQNLELLDVSEATDLYDVFMNDINLKNIDVSKWNTENVNNMNRAFLGTKNLLEINLENWDTSNVQDLSSMFSDSGVEKLNLKAWSTEAVEYAQNMFSGAANLKELDISNFNTRNIVDMDGFLDDVDKLNKLALGKDTILKNVDTLDENVAYSGNWIGLQSKQVYTSNESFFKEYDGSYPDTYIRERKEVSLTDGWHQLETGDWMYVSEGHATTGFLLLGDNYYYFSRNGIMQTGWLEDYGNSIFVNSEGIVLDGWQYIDEDWYYLGTANSDKLDPLLRRGWTEIDGKWYLLSEEGRMETGWRKYFEYGWIYLESDGSGQIGWKMIDGNWYYLENKNVYWTEDYYSTMPLMVSDWHIIDGEWYYFDSSGAMLNDWQIINGTWYYFNASGVMVDGWQIINGNWYYFNTSGSMLSGWQVIDNNWYYFNAGGTMQTGWLLLGNDWYYLESSGVMLTGEHKIDNVWYSFSSNGVMQ